MLNNLWIFELINGYSHRSLLLDWTGIFLADFVAYAIALLGIVVYFYPRHRRAHHRRMIIVALVSGLFARFVIKSIIILFYQAPRPFVALSDVTPLILLPRIEQLQSFPSGHALFFFACSTAVLFFNKKLGVVLLIASTLMGIARVFCGVHWPYDIVWGAALGIGSGYLVYWLYSHYKKKIDKLISKIF